MAPLPAPAVSALPALSFDRPAFVAGMGALSPTLVGLVPFALIAGVAGTGVGLTPWQTIGLSLLTFSGIAQLMVCQLLAIASPVAVILLATLVVSLRFLMYSAALAPHLGHLPLRWKLGLSYLTTDQGFAASLQHFTEGRGVGTDATGRAWYHLGGGLMQWTLWQAGVAVGALLGAQVPAAWSLDFAVPLSFLAMLVPAVRNRGTLVAAVAGGVVALTAAGLPFRLGLIVASVAGIAAGALWSAREARQAQRPHPAEQTGERP